MGGKGGLGVMVWGFNDGKDCIGYRKYYISVNDVIH